MAQHGNNDRGDWRRGGGSSGDDGRRWDERDRRGSQQSSLSPRGEQMGGYYTGGERNYGGGQGNYGGSSAEDWGRGSQGGTDWHSAPGGYGRDT